MALERQNESEYLHFDTLADHRAGCGMNMKTSVRVDGRDWNLFSVHYTTPDGEFSFTIYAISFEHAAAMLEDIKANARLDGQVMGSIDT